MSITLFIIGSCITTFQQPYYWSLRVNGDVLLREALALRWQVHFHPPFYRIRFEDLNFHWKKKKDKCEFESAPTSVLGMKLSKSESRRAEEDVKCFSLQGQLFPAK